MDDSRSKIRKGLSVCTVLIVLLPLAASAQDDNGATEPAQRLGKRLFLEKRFTNPASNFAANCYACHRPDWAPEGRRAYSDLLRYSLVPTDSFGRKRTTLRNAPSLMDIAGRERFNHDGRFASLREAIAAELISRHLGWLPEERETALDEIHMVLLSDGGVDQIAEGTYIEQFASVYDIDLATMSRDEAVGSVVKCLTGYVAGLKSPRTSAFDAFAVMNGLPAGPKDGESIDEYRESLLTHLAQLDHQGALKIHAGFSSQAYEGFKIFMRTTGDSSSGNCVACHSPPRFTDGAFHNTGVAQAEYDAAHGDGAFVQLEVPGAAAADRPLERFGPRLETGEQVNADLGYWNFVKRTEAASETEQGDSSLADALGTFKTPTLRNLMYTDPYMHNGAYATLEDAMAQKVKTCALAKSRALRNGDAAMSAMNITERDIAPLVAFLTTLNDLSAEEFAQYCRSGKRLTPIDRDR